MTTFLTLVYIVFVNPSILSGTPDLPGTRLQFDQVLAVTALDDGLLTILMDAFDCDNAIDRHQIRTDGSARLPKGAWLTSPSLALADGSHVYFHFGILGGGVVAVSLAADRVQRLLRLILPPRTV